MLVGPLILSKSPFSWSFSSVARSQDCDFPGTMVTSSTSDPSVVPSPIVIPASQNYEGNDGPWSSFTVRIGSPAQDVNVLVSTASGQTLAIAPQGCVTSDPSECAHTRGGLFDADKSSSWRPNILSPNGTDTYRLDLEKNLGYSGNGMYGYDTVSLGWQGSGGPSLDHQIVAGIATQEFYGQQISPTSPTLFPAISQP